jgi:hypothetical protein
VNDDPRIRIWKSLPWAKYTACCRCGGMHYCYGKNRRRMVCLACFTAPLEIG